MKRDLDGYQIGLHNIGLGKYKGLFNLRADVKEDIWLTGGDISEKWIAESIIKYGLKVIDRPFGARSTVMPIENLSDESLNYTYNMEDIGLVWNIIVAIPYYISYKGNEYFIGYINDWISFCNMLMFNPVIYKEFIYGYYTKEIIGKEVDERGLSTLSFSDDLDFVVNPSFFGSSDDNLKDLILSGIFDNDKRLLESLKLVNNREVLRLLFRTSFERFIIRNGRKQVKTLKYVKK